MLDDLSQSQVQIHLTLSEQLQVAAAAAGLSLTLDPVGQLQLDEARLKANSSHRRSGGRHLDPLRTRKQHSGENLSLLVLLLTGFIPGILKFN